MCNRWLTPKFFFLVNVSLLIGMGIGCDAEQADYQTDTAFYHWRTELNLSAEESGFLVNVSAKRLYCKFFDVDVDRVGSDPTPRAVIAVSDSAANLQNYEIVPVVFLTNRSFQDRQPGFAAQLAERVVRLIEQRAEYFPTSHFPEYQFDCDWTPSTRALYFEFLKEVRKLLPQGTLLSATIRLHQIRYPEQTGIPPVDRGALMCYNVGEVDRWETDNSILTADAAAAYLKATPDYALPLDIALPVFSWGAVYRHGQLVRLLNNLTAGALSDTSRYEVLGEGRFRIAKSGYLHGQYLYRDDRIRTETVTPAVLRSTAELLHDYLPPADRHLIWYHLDTTTIRRYESHLLDSIALAL